MKKFVTAAALVAAMVVAAGAAAQSSQSSGSDQSSGTSAASGQSAQSGVLVDVNAIVGATVRAQGKDIGKVDRLMVDPKDGRVRTVVIQQGGTFGVGGKSVSLPWEAVKVAQDGGRIVVTAEQQMLEQAPAASPRSDSKSDSSSKSESSKSEKK